MSTSIISQRTNLVTGLLSLTANQTNALDQAVFSAGGSAPNQCRGVTIQLRSGSVKLVDMADATDGWTLTAGVPFGDDTAASLDGWYFMETAGSTAEIEVICRTGGIS